MAAEDTLNLTAAEMARYIDHTLLKPEATPAAFDTLCAEAVQHGFKAVCVNPAWIAYVADKLEDIKRDEDLSRYIL